jgi:hypothetical protein
MPMFGNSLQRQKRYDSSYHFNSDMAEKDRNILHGSYNLNVENMAI